MKLDKNHFFTTEDLFDGIIEKVKGTEKWEEAIIDYSLATRPLDLYRYEFNPEFVLARGNNEGIYMDLAIYGYFEPAQDVKKYHIGTIKTLREGKESMIRMALLYGECLNAFYDVMDDHLDDMTRMGFDLHFPDSPCGFGYSEISTREKALERWESMKNTYSKAILRDNLTRKEENLGGES